MSIHYDYTPGWDAGARTIVYVAEDGEFTFCLPTTDIGVVCGLSDKSDRAKRIEDILYGFYVEKGKYCIIEKGEEKTSRVDMPYPNTEFKITRVNDIIRYYVAECTCDCVN